MTKILLHKQEDTFHPYDQEALEYFGKLKENAIYMAEIKRPRNPRFHNRAMAIFRELFGMTDDEGRIGFDPWRKLMLIKAGYFTSLGKVSVNGDVTTAIEAKSMNFESMTEDQFQQCFNDILTAFGEKYGRDLTLEQLETWSRY